MLYIEDKAKVHSASMQVKLLYTVLNINIYTQSKQGVHKKIR